MRVMIVNVHFAPESFGGATIVAEESAVRLGGLGHDVTVVTTTAAPWLGHGQMRRYEAEGVQVIALRHSSDHSVKGEYDDVVIANRFRQILAATQPDVVHFHAMQMLGVSCVEVAQEMGIPTVVTLHDAWWLCERQFMVRANGRYCGQTGIDARVCATCVPFPAEHEARQQRSLAALEGCARVLVPSEFWRRLMVASGLPDERVFVNANGVARPADGWAHPRHDGPVRLGFVGGIHEAKGHKQIVAALQHLRRSDYELWVVDSLMNLGGSGFSEEDWDVPGYLRILPGYNRESMDDFFGAIDVLLFPSQWKESYGLTVREAALRGVWPIVTDGGGTVEHMIDGVNGSVIPLDGGYEALAAAVEAVLESPTEFIPQMAESERLIASLDGQTRDLAEHLQQAVDLAAAGRQEGGH